MNEGTVTVYNNEEHQSTEQELRQKIKQELMKKRGKQKREEIEFLLKRL